MADPEGIAYSPSVRLNGKTALAVACIAAAGIALAITDASGGTHPTRLTQALGKPSQLALLQPATRRQAGSRLAGLSLAQLAGQRVIYAYQGLTPPRSLLTRIYRGEAAGVILFTPNIGSRKQVRAAVAEMQNAANASILHTPILVMTDQEGGQVRRLPGAPELSEGQIGESPDALALAAEAGRTAGINLAGVGINVNLAPVLDVYRQRGNFIAGYQRSYGMNRSLVAELGGAFIRAQQLTGVAATAKHFPGLGAAEASQDTDRGPVTLGLSLDEIRTMDERPYVTAISAGVRLVMTSWAVYPALDPRLPAGLSSTVIEGELRGRLGFKGVTVSDSLGAAALETYGDYASRGVGTAKAGADLILCAAHEVSENSPGEGIQVLHGLAAAIATGAITRATAEAAAGRVLELRLNP